MSESIGERPAFPVPGMQEDAYFNGMSMRDYFAAKAMQGLLSSDSFSQAPPSNIAMLAYGQATAMLNERLAKQEVFENWRRAVIDRRSAYDSWMAGLTDPGVATPKVSAAERIAELEGQLANLSNEAFQQQHSNLALKKTIAELKEFLHLISLASESSASSRRECGEIARKALARVTP